MATSMRRRCDGSGRRCGCGHDWPACRREQKFACQPIDLREDAADLASDGGAGANALAVLRNGYLLETVEIAQQVGPFDGEAMALAQVGQLLSQHQGEERAEHMTADGGI